MCGWATLPMAFALECAGLASRHLQRLEHFAMHQGFVRHASRCGGHFAGDDVHKIVVRILRTKTLLRLQVREASENVGARDMRSAPATT